MLLRRTLVGSPSPLVTFVDTPRLRRRRVSGHRVGSSPRRYVRSSVTPHRTRSFLVPRARDRTDLGRGSRKEGSPGFTGWWSREIPRERGRWCLLCRRVGPTYDNSPRGPDVRRTTSCRGEYPCKYPSLLSVTLECRERRDSRLDHHVPRVKSRPVLVSGVSVRVVYGGERPISRRVTRATQTRERRAHEDPGPGERPES